MVEQQGNFAVQLVAGLGIGTVTRARRAFKKQGRRHPGLCREPTTSTRLPLKSMLGQWLMVMVESKI